MEYREGVIYVLHKVPEDSNWAEVVGGREVQSVIGVEYGFAEEVVAMIEFVDGSFLVGIGEPLRPFEELYIGLDHMEATKAFLEAVREHSWMEVD